MKTRARFDRSGRYTPVAAAKKTVVAGPDTTGGRTLTGPEAKSTVDPATGLAALSAPPKPGKKVKREKIRFGQAPRDTLPAGGADEVLHKPVAMGALLGALGRMAAKSAGGEIVLS